MSQQQTKPKPVPVQYRPIKYFLSSLNTHFGHVIINRIRNQSQHPQNPNRIIGTVVKNPSQQKYNLTPQGVRKIIQTQKIQFFHDVLLNSDVIIYDLNSCDFDQVQSAISALKINQYKQDKILICVSNIMTWANSKPKQKKQGEQQQGDQNPVQEPDSQQEGQPLAEQTQEKKTYVRFTQKDYNLRRPHPSYEKMKSIQTLCLAAGTAKKNLKTYVVCSGILYGAGQKLLQPYFMQARLQKPPVLAIFGKGKNRIPMIHLYDLVTYIEKIIQKKPAIPYVLAIDQNPKPTQKKIIEAISKGIGTGRTSHVPIDKSLNNIDILTLNIRIKPSMYFTKLEQEQAAIQVQEGTQVKKFKFNWQSKEGVQKNIQKLRQQFNKAFNLKQQKIYIVGPPGCGKSYLAKKLSEKYYLPHLHIKQVLEQVKILKNQLGEQINNAYNQKKQSQIAAKQQQYEANKQKWKKIPKQLRQPLASFNPDKVDVRLSDQLIYKCFKWRLEQNDCLNRGYILDGFPRKYQDAKEIFMGFPQLPEGQEPDENTKKVVDQRLVPTKYILLQKSDQQILNHLQSLPQQKIMGTHYTQTQAKRRLKIYRKLMDESTGDFIITDFFIQNKIQMHNIQVTAQTQALLQSIIKPIQVVQEQQIQKVNKLIDQQRQRKNKLRQQMMKKQQIIRNIQAQDYRMKKQNQQNQQRQILDKKSLALRKYLDVNLVPILSQGILQILRDFPKDPVDRLAEFLFKNSLKVPNPDPSTFQF